MLTIDSSQDRMNCCWHSLLNQLTREHDGLYLYPLFTVSLVLPNPVHTNWHHKRWWVLGRPSEIPCPILRIDSVLTEGSNDGPVIPVLRMTHWRLSFSTGLHTLPNGNPCDATGYIYVPFCGLFPIGHVGLLRISRMSPGESKWRKTSCNADGGHCLPSVTGSVNKEWWWPLYNGLYLCFLFFSPSCFTCACTACAHVAWDTQASIFGDLSNIMVNPIITGNVVVMESPWWPFWSNTGKSLWFYLLPFS